MAYHEAGHAIACHTLGSRVLAVSLIPNDTPWGIDGDGYCLAVFPSNVDGTARNAEPVDPVIRTTHMGQSIVECELLTGTGTARALWQAAREPC